MYSDVKEMFAYEPGGSHAPSLTDETKLGREFLDLFMACNSSRHTYREIDAWMEESRTRILQALVHTSQAEYTQQQLARNMTQKAQTLLFEESKMNKSDTLVLIIVCKFSTGRLFNV